MVLDCFAASGPEWLVIIDGTMNSALYQKILKENVRPSVCDLKLKSSWVMQQDSDPKHTSKSTSELLKVLEWPNQSPDLNLIEKLWHDLSIQSIHARKPSSEAELKQCCKEKWAKIPPQRCERLMASYSKLQLINNITTDCSCCCKGWHNQLLDLGAITFTRTVRLRQVWTASFP